MQSEKLQKEIDSARAEIRTDGYVQSIGEWISLYEKNEIYISPAFQRFFRWIPEQKSRLIESILLGIPIPPIFVAQREDNIWEVIDGLQRLSTIYEFVGILKNKGGEVQQPLRLTGTKYLPSLEGILWESEDPSKCLSMEQRVQIKRSKIGVSILLTANEGRGKYELFQRLNTGGTALSDQEVRNAIMVMLDEKFFDVVAKMAEFEPFLECVSLSDNSLKERYDMDLVTRFIVLRNSTEKDLSNIGDLNIFLNDRIVDIIESGSFDLDNEVRVFQHTFSSLYEEVGSDCMKRYSEKKGKFEGGFVISAFETVALGLSHNIEKIAQFKGSVRKMIIDLWSNYKITGSAGMRASTRIPQTVMTGRNFFKGED